MKKQDIKPLCAQDLYAQRDDKFFVRTDKRLKKRIKEYCISNNTDVSKIINDTLIWTLCKRGIIPLPFQPPKKLKLTDWWDEKDNSKSKLKKVI